MNNSQAFAPANGQAKPKTGAEIIAQNVGAFTGEEIRNLVTSGIIPDGTPSAQIELYARTCKARGLNPFLKQVYLMPFNTRDRQGNYVTQYALVVGIDGARVLADQSGEYAGQDEPLFNDGKTEYQMLKSGEKIITATVTLYRIVGGVRVPFSATASWASYLPANEKKRKMWNQFPHLMISKCAEMLAFRKGFPAAFGGLYAEQEMDQAVSGPAKSVEYTEIDPLPEALDKLRATTTTESALNVEKEFSSLNHRTEWPKAVERHLGAIKAIEGATTPQELFAHENDYPELSGFAEWKAIRDTRMDEIGESIEGEQGALNFEGEG